MSLLKSFESMLWSHDEDLIRQAIELAIQLEEVEEIKEKCWVILMTYAGPYELILSKSL